MKPNWLKIHVFIYSMCSVNMWFSVLVLLFWYWNSHFNKGLCIMWSLAKSQCHLIMLFTQWGGNEYFSSLYFGCIPKCNLIEEVFLYFCTQIFEKAVLYYSVGTLIALRIKGLIPHLLITYGLNFKIIQNLK